MSDLDNKIVEVCLELGTFRSHEIKKYIPELRHLSTRDISSILEYVLIIKNPKGISVTKKIFPPIGIIWVVNHVSEKD